MEIVPSDLGLAPEVKTSLESSFSGFFKSAREWREKADSISDPKEARSARLEIKRLRVAAEKQRKKLKEDSLRMGKAIDGANNILLALIVPIEKGLEDIEKKAEREEAERIAALHQVRMGQLNAIDHDTRGLHVGGLSSEDWESYLSDAKELHSARVEKARREKEEADAKAKAEAERIEKERIENIRLRKEAEARAAEAEKARKEQEVIAKKAAEEAAKERRKIEAEAKKAAEERAAIEAEAKALRDAETARVKAENDARIEAERVKAEEVKLAEIAAKKAASAPDKAKLMEFAKTVRALTVPQTKSPEGEAVATEIKKKTESFASWIENQASTL